jgi:acetyl esterase/lipase
MASERMRELIQRMRAVPIQVGTPVAEQRAIFDRMALTFPVPETVKVTTIDADGVPCEWIDATGTGNPRVLVYLHGGGYVIGSAQSHRETMARFSRALDTRVLYVGYRLAPEHPCPAQVVDVVTVYRWLLTQGVTGPEIALTGESAGGGLTMATLVYLREAGLPLPAAAAVVSPWVDLTLTGQSHVDNADDPLSSAEVVDQYRRWFNPDRPFDDPRVSPVFADLHGLPPVYVAASESERLRDDAVLLTERLRAAGVDVTCDLQTGAIHAWTLFPHLPEARETVERIAEFITGRWAPTANHSQESR